MLRSIVRTGRCLARKQINTSKKITQCSLLFMRKGFSSTDNTLVRLSSTQNISSQNTQVTNNLDQAVFEKICSETLESLFEYFEELIDQSPNLKGADIIFSDGVLTVDFGENYGTYVINRQSPNKQIWLSSPVSGPKRYDLELKNGGYWIYKHDGIALHSLLQSEISQIVEKIDLKSCAHSLV